MIAALLLASSLLWAGYKMKPGIISCAGGGKAAGLAISDPKPATTFPLLVADASKLLVIVL